MKKIVLDESGNDSTTISLSSNLVKLLECRLRNMKLLLLILVT